MPTETKEFSSEPPNIAAGPFSLKELAEIVVKHQGIKSGFYDLAVQMNVGFGAVGPNKDAKVPGVMIGVGSFALIATDTIGPNTVDAATVAAKSD